MIGLAYDEALSVLCAASGDIALTVSRNPAAPLPSTPSLPAPPASSAPSIHPATISTSAVTMVKSAISPSLPQRSLLPTVDSQQEMTLEIQRGANGLGLGLKLALLPVSTAAIVIREILPESSMALDGRLMAGDRLLAINGQDFAKSSDTEGAMEALLQGTNRPIHLRFLRDVTTTFQDDDLYQVQLSYTY